MRIAAPYRGRLPCLAKFSILTVAILYSQSILQAISVTTIGSLSALGGQYFTGVTHSSGFNLDSSFVPVITFTPKLYLMPIYIGSYHQTQSIYNFLGQNTLIEGQLDQTGVLRGDWAIDSKWRLKPRAGYSKEWIKQSTDESLWNGLFNYNRAFGGISAERALPNGSFEIGYEYGHIEYPHYQSLDANPLLTTTGITAVTGANVLNFNSHTTSFDYHWKTDSRNAAFDANMTWVREDFVDQKVITQDESAIESVIDKSRTDDVFILTLHENVQPSTRWALNLTETGEYYLSNQNSFDASQAFSTPFTYGYYDFMDFQFSPSLTFYWDDARWDMTIGGTGGIRQYAHRRAQDGEGNYVDSLIYSLDRGGSLAVRYRIWKGLHAVVTGNALTYSSNTRFEANYPYNYTVYTYLGGLSWDF